MISLSAVDRERFGVVTARCCYPIPGGIAEVGRYCRSNRVQLLISRCDSADHGAAHAIEGLGGRLMDALVYYSRSLASAIPDLEEGGATIRPYQPGEAQAVRAVAIAAFAGYLGHYHADPRLERAKADEAYADWAHRSCMSREVADEVLVAEEGRTIVGFATLRGNDLDEAEIVLNGVAPAAQRGGVYRRLLLGSLGWARAKGVARLIVSTQLSNVPPQKVWVRAGFEPLRAVYTFHSWFP
jgi:GNAT superfamily N-acetyltransferase